MEGGAPAPPSASKPIIPCPTASIPSTCLLRVKIRIQPIFFVTVCTAKRKPILATPQVSNLLSCIWKKQNKWLMGRYVIMPDHIHFFCSPSITCSFSLNKWIHYWKSLSSRDWPNPASKPIWQTDFWDRTLRTDEKYEEKWEYVVNNPVRQGLVTHSYEWIFQGEIHQL
ncbi:MAG: transposase [Verrucomicrobiae bacterium]|nr:transposase [Verrucomicrobiae bacterium]